jgi:hypothetical protein
MVIPALTNTELLSGTLFVLRGSTSHPVYSLIGLLGEPQQLLDSLLQPFPAPQPTNDRRLPS